MELLPANLYGSNENSQSIPEELSSALLYSQPSFLAILVRLWLRYAAH